MSRNTTPGSCAERRTWPGLATAEAGIARLPVFPALAGQLEPPLEKVRRLRVAVAAGRLPWHPDLSALIGIGTQGEEALSRCRRSCR